MTWIPWTIVHRVNGQPVLPIDCADSGLAEDEALLVFRSEAAARAGCRHQSLWEVDAVPRLLADVIAAEAAGQPPTQDPLREDSARARIYAAQGLGVVGRIGPQPGSDATTADGRFIGGDGHGGERM